MTERTYSAITPRKNHQWPIYRKPQLLKSFQTMCCRQTLLTHLRVQTQLPSL